MSKQAEEIKQAREAQKRKYRLLHPDADEPAAPPAEAPKEPQVTFSVPATAEELAKSPEQARAALKQAVLDFVRTCDVERVTSKLVRYKMYELFTRDFCRENLATIEENLLEGVNRLKAASENPMEVEAEGPLEVQEKEEPLMKPLRDTVLSVYRRKDDYPVTTELEFRRMIHRVLPADFCDKHLPAVMAEVKALIMADEKASPAKTEPEKEKDVADFFKAVVELYKDDKADHQTEVVRAEMLKRFPVDVVNKHLERAMRLGIVEQNYPTPTEEQKQKNKKEEEEVLALKNAVLEMFKHATADQVREAMNKRFPAEFVKMHVDWAISSAEYATREVKEKEAEAEPEESELAQVETAEEKEKKKEEEEKEAQQMPRPKRRKQMTLLDGDDDGEDLAEDVEAEKKREEKKQEKDSVFASEDEVDADKEKKQQDKEKAEGMTELDKIRKILYCSVCQDVCTMPLILGCGHLLCVSHYHEQARRTEPGEPVTCPECRKPILVPPVKCYALQQAANFLEKTDSSYSEDRAPAPELVRRESTLETLTRQVRTLVDQFRASKAPHALRMHQNNPMMVRAAIECWLQEDKQHDCTVTYADDRIVVQSATVVHV